MVNLKKLVASRGDDDSYLLLPQRTHPNERICPVTRDPFGFGTTAPMILECRTKREDDPRCMISKSAYDDLKQLNIHTCVLCRGHFPYNAYTPPFFTPPHHTEELIDFEQTHGVTDGMIAEMREGRRTLDLIPTLKQLPPHPTVHYYIGLCYTSLSQSLLAIRSFLVGLTQYNFDLRNPHHLNNHIYLTLELLKAIEKLTEPDKKVDGSQANLTVSKRIYDTRKIPQKKLAGFITNCFDSLPTDTEVMGVHIYSHLILLLYYAYPHLDGSVCSGHKTSLVEHLQQKPKIKRELLRERTLLEATQTLYSGDEACCIFIQELLCLLR